MYWLWYSGLVNHKHVINFKIRQRGRHIHSTIYQQNILGNKYGLHGLNVW